MINKDARYERYRNDPKFNQAVKVMYAMIYEHKMAYQDLLDAAFVAYMKFQLENPEPISMQWSPPKDAK